MNSAIFALAAVTIALTACSEEQSLLGTVLTTGDPAPGFRLRDQFDRPVSLKDYSQDVIVLTFLYTECSDICPVVANHLRDIYHLLGEEADDVWIIVISVDPLRDSVEVAHTYSEKWEMLENWSYLIGDWNELSSVWDAYFVAPAVDDVSNLTTTGSGQPVTRTRRGVDMFLQDVLGNYTITHSAPLYLIDREGILRVLFTLPMDPEEIVHDIRRLLD